MMLQQSFKLVLMSKMLTNSNLKLLHINKNDAHLCTHRSTNISYFDVWCLPLVAFTLCLFSKYYLLTFQTATPDYVTVAAPSHLNHIRSTINWKQCESQKNARCKSYSYAFMWSIDVATSSQQTIRICQYIIVKLTVDVGKVWDRKHYSSLNSICFNTQKHTANLGIYAKKT